jgi:hypothetical protein
MFMRRGLVKAFPCTAFVFDKVIDNGCSRRRPDVFIDLLTHVVIVECDETQHRGSSYGCETRRTMELFEDVNRRPTVFIRFNPDAYRVGDVRVGGCFSEDVLNGEKVLTSLPSWKGRLKELCCVFEGAMRTIPDRAITEIRVCYNKD